MSVLDRFLTYVSFPTGSDEESAATPSTARQLELGRFLADELRSLVPEVRFDESTGCVYAFLPANDGTENAIGFISHMDTSPAAPCENVKPRVIGYGGGDIALENGLVTDEARFPNLKNYVGKHLVVTDGNTLLGADDKAGVAEIMTACERLLGDPLLKHGRVCIGFTPDEEIGRGADRFDVDGFGADFAYTVDGGAVGSINYETFNAAAGTVTVHGRCVHPGSAKNVMLNASLIAMEFAAMLPPQQRPEHTEGREGFFHLCDMQGQETRATLRYIIRDHDRQRFEARKRRFAAIADYLNGVYGPGTVEVCVADTYYNMRELIEPRMEIVERACAAFRAAGVEPWFEPVRGGTDGCRLSHMGLLCPNLSTGGMNYHGCHECIAIEDMDLMADVLVRLITA